MTDETLIKVENVGKTFKLPHEKNNSLKSLVTSLGRRNRSFELQQTLKNVSFEVKKGEFFGIVGRNGSGKSTLLKLLAGIYTPTEGTVQVNGSLTPFIELGVGFNPELTGRENVYLNGALLGFNRKEMSKMYKEIVEFAELKDFMDQKLKNYSSGMQVRLAFSIAIRAESQILLIDEVLAVGDSAFQQKCYDIFEKLKAQKKTIVFVSHDMGAVERFCNQAILIESGEIIKQGSAQEIGQIYKDLNDEKIARDTLKDNVKRGKKSDIEIILKGKGGNELPSFHYGDQVSVEVKWPKKIKADGVGVAIYRQSGEYIFGVNTKLDKFKVESNYIKYSFEAKFGEGRYFVIAALMGSEEGQILELNSSGPTFKLLAQKDQPWEGMVHLNHTWENKNV